MYAWVGMGVMESECDCGGGRDADGGCTCPWSGDDDD